MTRRQTLLLHIDWKYPTFIYSRQRAVPPTTDNAIVSFRFNSFSASCSTDNTAKLGARIYAFIKSWSAANNTTDPPLGVYEFTPHASAQQLCRSGCWWHTASAAPDNVIGFSAMAELSLQRLWFFVRWLPLSSEHIRALTNRF